ncbi:MAG: hypothetical protein RBS39_02375 [Phycisphaerales bacterium]|jgi:hypothetical protein|nr:hypothetical protein [Phycisphaerales bacterium]
MASGEHHAASDAPFDDGVVARCGRCGYDRSGEIATWTDRCPLEGTCPECGLTLPWVDVLRAERNLCRGFIEHVPRRVPGCSRVRHVLRWFAAAWRTWFWALLPWRLWSRVKVWQPVSVFRAALGFVIIMGTLHALNALLMLAQHAVSPYSGMFSAGFPWGPALRECALGPFSQLQELFWNGFTLGGGAGYYDQISIEMFLLLIFCVPVALACGVPALFAVLPHTRWSVPIRAAHLTRTAAHALLPITLAWMVCVIDSARMVYLYIWYSGNSPPQYSSGGWILFNSWPTELFWQIFDYYPQIFLALLVWHAIYWTAVLRSWGIRRPALHAVLLLVPIALTLVILALMFWRHWWLIEVLA